MESPEPPSRRQTFLARAPSRDELAVVTSWLPAAVRASDSARTSAVESRGNPTLWEESPRRNSAAVSRRRPNYALRIDQSPVGWIELGLPRARPPPPGPVRRTAREPRSVWQRLVDRLRHGLDVPSINAKLGVDAAERHDDTSWSNGYWSPTVMGIVCPSVWTYWKTASAVVVPLTNTGPSMTTCPSGRSTEAIRCHPL